jgi:hypothetical protein
MRLSGVQQSIKVGARGGRFIFTPARRGEWPTRRKSIDDVELVARRALVFAFWRPAKPFYLCQTHFVRELLDTRLLFYVCVRSAAKQSASPPARESIHAARTKYQRSQSEIDAHTRRVYKHHGKCVYVCHSRNWHTHQKTLAACLLFIWLLLLFNMLQAKSTKFLSALLLF